MDAIIFDLGLSSIQLDDLSRGFSFKSKDKLNMNMGLSDLNLIEVNYWKEILQKLQRLQVHQRCLFDSL